MLFRSSVTISNSVTEIGYEAFASNKLKSVTIPNSVTEIGHFAFMGNAKLKKITVSKNNKNYCSIDGVLFSKDKKTLVYRPEGLKGKTYKIPSYITTIGDSAFFHNNLTSVTIPNSVTVIGDWAFYNNKLTSVTIPNSVTYIDLYAFGYNYNSETEEHTKVKGFTIKGKSGSAAETYAEKNGFKFIAA